MIKILSIGNSFSEDAQRYVHGIARADGIKMKTVNLYIGGCDLAKHYRNMLSGRDAYDFQINGINYTGLKISLDKALLLDEWDYITIQQQSLQSCNEETFIPYIDELNAHVRKYCPKAKIFMIETWGYKKDSQKLIDAGYSKHEAMLYDIRKTYKRIAERINADGIIFAGEAVLLANKENYENIYRDEFHMSKGFGRYLQGLMVYGTLMQRNIEENSFCDFDEEITEDDVALAKRIATEILSR